MLRNGSKEKNESRAILSQAIKLLAELEPDRDVTLDSLIGFIADQDSRLVDALGRLDLKHLRPLVDALETVRLNYGQLFADHGRSLDVDLLFGRGEFDRPGKTSLSIISTKFLGDDVAIEFWVTQLLAGNHTLGKSASFRPTAGGNNVRRG
jgi:hypothetical protein